MELEKKRIDIDRIDRQLVDLLTARAEICRDIAMAKAAAGLPVRDRHREREVLGRISADDAGIENSIRRIFETIMAESRNSQHEIHSSLETEVIH